MQSTGVGENPTSSDQGGSKNLPDAPCAATCLDAQEGYSIPPDLQRTDSNRFLISRYDFSLSAASASGCEHFTPCVQASSVFTSGSDNVTPCSHCPHQGVNSSPPVANRRFPSCCQESSTPNVSTAALKDLLLAQREVHWTSFQSSDIRSSAPPPGNCLILTVTYRLRRRQAQLRFSGVSTIFRVSPATQPASSRARSPSSFFRVRFRCYLQVSLPCYTAPRSVGYGTSFRRVRHLVP